MLDKGIMHIRKILADKFYFSANNLLKSLTTILFAIRKESPKRVKRFFDNNSNQIINI